MTIQSLRGTLKDKLKVQVHTGIGTVLGDCIIIFSEIVQHNNRRDVVVVNPPPEIATGMRQGHLRKYQIAAGEKRVCKNGVDIIVGRVRPCRIGRDQIRQIAISRQHIHEPILETVPS